MLIQFGLLRLNKRSNTNSEMISVCFSLTTNTFKSQKKLVFRRNPRDKPTRRPTAKTVVNNNVTNRDARKC